LEILFDLSPVIWIWDGTHNVIEVVRVARLIPDIVDRVLREPLLLFVVIDESIIVPRMGVLNVTKPRNLSGCAKASFWMRIPPTSPPAKTAFPIRRRSRRASRSPAITSPSYSFSCCGTSLGGYPRIVGKMTV